MPGNFIAIDGREKAKKCDEISKDRAWNYHHSLKNSYLAVTHKELLDDQSFVNPLGAIGFFHRLENLIK
jgi:hypothetical protein